jgi:hypothetical protein
VMIAALLAVMMRSGVGAFLAVSRPIVAAK